ncbi:hypothetical protein MferCBS31731_000113 [Microsporum ferrugineum]
MDTSYNAAVKEFLRYRRELLANSIESGEFQHLVFPRDFASVPIVLLALFIKWPCNGPFKYTRHLLYFYSLYLNVYVIIHCRSLMVLGGYGVGLIFSWLSIWSAALLLFNDVQGSFKRIERSFVPLKAVKSNLSNELNEKLGSDSARLRITQNQSNYTHGQANGTTTSGKLVQRFRWQGYPKSLGHRFSWIIDIFLSHRGPHWNWRPKDFPPLPKQVQSQLARDKDTELNEDELWEEDTRTNLMATLCRTLVYYFCLDLLKVIVIRDPYFVGYIDSPPPPFLDFCGFLAPMVARLYRSTVNGMAVYFAVVFPTSLSATVFLAISRTPLRFKTRTPFEASFLYPPYFGDLLSSILDRGLIGLWGTCWHKHFRAGFLAPGNWVKSVVFLKLNGGIKWPPLIFWGLQVFISFTLSGIVHFAGSYTQMAPTNPSRQFLFFALQIVGIFLQVLIEKLSKRLMPFEVPLWLKQLSKSTFVFVWMACSSPLLCDDFVIGRVWVEEPVPYSLIRAMGFATGTGGAMRWEAEPIRWWRGERWWERGIIL